MPPLEQATSAGPSSRPSDAPTDGPSSKPSEDSSSSCAGLVAETERDPGNFLAAHLGEGVAKPPGAAAMPLRGFLLPAYVFAVTALCCPGTGAAVAAAEGAVHAGDAPDSSSLGDMLALGTASPDFANLPGERNRQRDWAILRGFKAGLEAHTILTKLRESKLLGDELWSGVAVTERHAQIVAAILVVQDLMGLDDPMHVMCALFGLSDR